MARHENSISLYNGQIFPVESHSHPKDIVLRDYIFVVKMCNTGISKI